MSTDSLMGIKLGQFTVVFVPMGLLIAWALIYPELGGDLELGRTKLTIWATTILLAPALVLHMFRSLGQAIANLSYLLWSAALVVFLLHAYWAIFIIFDGVADTFRQQGLLIAGSNFLLLALWVLDVALLWLLPGGLYGWRVQFVVRLLTFAIFAITLVVLRGGDVQLLGFIFVGLVVLAGLVRIGTQVRAPSATQETGS